MLRVVQVVSTLDVGGIEIWLKNLIPLFQQLTRGRIQVDFLTVFRNGGELEEELLALGCNVHHVPLQYRRLARSCLRLTQFFRRGRYDTVHSQCNFTSGIILPCAQIAGIRRRYMHVHNSVLAFHSDQGTVRWLVGRVMRYLALASCDKCLCCSEEARSAFGANLTYGRRKFHILHCGVKLDDFRAVRNRDKREIRARLGWDTAGPVLLHVGRHSHQKNLHFLLESFCRFLERAPTSLLAFVGMGSLTDGLRALAHELGIDANTRFLGYRSDVPLLMRAADLLAIPSLHEGLPVVMIEALAAGLPIVAAEQISHEVDIVPGMIHWYPTTHGEVAWAREMHRVLSLPRPEIAVCIERLSQSDFDLQNGARSLLKLYGFSEQVAM